MKKLLVAATCLLLAAPALAGDCPQGQVHFGNQCIPAAPERCPVGQYKLSGACAKPNPEQGIEILKEGNARFVRGRLAELEKNSRAVVRREIAVSPPGQKPFAVILTCSDSRLPPEILFDKGLGEIFVVRVAGNIVAPHELGSIEYGLEHLGANLVVVLGHERCGAVRATYDTYPAHGTGNIGSLMDSIYPAVDRVLQGAAKPTDAAAQAAQVEQCVAENINLVAEAIVAQSPVVEHLLSLGETRIVKAKYDLDTGKVVFLP